jgi:hypothetical protein
VIKFKLCVGGDFDSPALMLKMQNFLRQFELAFAEIWLEDEDRGIDTKWKVQRFFLQHID